MLDSVMWMHFSFIFIYNFQFFSFWKNAFLKLYQTIACLSILNWANGSSAIFQIPALKIENNFNEFDCSWKLNCWIFNENENGTFCDFLKTEIAANTELHITTKLFEITAQSKAYWCPKINISKWGQNLFVANDQILARVADNHKKLDCVR